MSRKIIDLSKDHDFIEQALSELSISRPSSKISKIRYRVYFKHGNRDLGHIDVDSVTAAIYESKMKYPYTRVRAVEELHE